MELDQLSITSISGIIGATMFLVEVLKRLTCQIGWFNKVPVFIYATLIALCLTFFANQVVKPPLLEGEIWKLMWLTVVSALASSGFYTWLHSPQSVENASRLGESYEVRRDCDGPVLRVHGPEQGADPRRYGSSDSNDSTGT